MQKVRKLIGNHCFKNCWTHDITWTNWFRNFLKKRCTQSKSSIHPMVGGAYHSSISSIDLLCSPPSWRTGLLYAFTSSTGSCLNPMNLPLSFLEKTPSADPKKCRKSTESNGGKVESSCWYMLMIYIHTWNNWRTQFLNGWLFKQPFPMVKIWNHPTETTIYKQMFQVPGVYSIHII